MSEQPRAETTTIVSDGNTIIIAHPPVQPETSFWDTISSFFASNEPSSTVPSSQPVLLPPVAQPVVEVIPVSLEIKPVQPTVEVVEVQAVQVVQDTSSWTDCFSAQNIANYKKIINDQIKSLQGADERWSRCVTRFKEQKLMSLGDVRTRSILSAFSSAVMYKLISINTVGFFRKTRNLGASFVFMGYWFVPELFNPFLRNPNLAQRIV